MCSFFLCVLPVQGAKPTEIAFDLECYNKSKYTQMTCLLQIAVNNSKEYVIDPLAPGVWETVGGLAPLFADPQIVKIGHSIGGLDVRCLHRDFGIFIVNAFDTYEAAQCLQLPSKGLAKVCAHYGLTDVEIYESLKEEYQTTDWTKRPLTKPMIQYGRYDVHYLIQLRRLMMRDLAKQELWETDDEKIAKHAEARRVATSLASMLRRFDEDEETCVEEEELPPNSLDDDEPETGGMSKEESEEEGERTYFYEAKELRMNLDLMQAISRSQERCLDLWTADPEPHLKIPDYQSLMVRSKKKEITWTPSQSEVYAKLVEWRARVADRQECTAGFVCELGFLASVAYKRPTSEVGLRQLNFFLPELLLLDNNDMELFDLVRRSRQADMLGENDDREIPCYEGYLEQEKSGRSVGIVASSGGFRGLVAVGIVACVAAIAVTVVTTSKRSR
jgi:ribonuclease D